MELNGVANIKMLLEIVKADFGHDYCIDEGEKAIQNIEEQLDLLERYMLAYYDAISSGSKPPYWHEVKANKLFYPTNKERYP